jgi:hypothetical protein
MTLHLDLLTAESAEAFLIRDVCAPKETPRTPRVPADKPEPVVPAPVSEALAGNWGY